MASILRATKFVRYFAGFARNIDFNTVRETEGSFIQQSQCSVSGYATSAASSSQGLDRSLKRLDEDVKSSGRISRRDLEDVPEEIRVSVLTVPLLALNRRGKSILRNLLEVQSVR
ncbi:uncharacterized protein LOC129739387 [Uranotaenia lowii]|uniref:uncharacterized protein LOC129739387 n=1 Tax=Uranotaenia lowii TaxID=190385 RepID=UPI002478AC86|nr:uncharacterized protein LOC129739387 [Uranotaenia lowii]